MVAHIRTARILHHQDSPQEDRKLFQSLYEQHREDLLRLVYRLTGDWSSAEDALQHAFTTLFAKRREYDLALPIKNLLTTIAINHARLQHRTRPRAESPGNPPTTPLDRQGRIEAAMKLARYATRRHQFIAFQNSFHGRTMGALSLTSSRPTQRRGFGPLLAGVTHIPYPNAYRCVLQSTPDSVGDAVLGYLENVVFRTTVSPDDVAAIVVEAVQGEGGYVVPPADFLLRLQTLVRKHGILIIADEVQCGMGRTGKMFAFEHSPGFLPDIITLAKGIASGMPLGVMMSSKDLMSWQPGAHASTFGGNPVCIAAALETIRLLRGKYVENAARVGDFLKRRLQESLGGHSSVGEIRGIGLMIGIELVKDRESKQIDTKLRDSVIEACFQRGLLLLGAGVSTIRLSPPLLIDEQQADCAVQILRAAMDAATA